MRNLDIRRYVIEHRTRLNAVKSREEVKSLNDEYFRLYDGWTKDEKKRAASIQGKFVSEIENRIQYIDELCVKAELLLNTRVKDLV